jgi:hypothetical protein
MPRYMPKFQAEVIPDDVCVMADVGNAPEKYASVVCEVVYTTKKDKHGNDIQVYSHFERKPNIQNGGVMLFFPQGHSIHVESEEQAERTFKLNMRNPLVDMETGEEVPEDFNTVDYKKVVERNTQHSNVRSMKSFNAKFME